MAPFDDWNNIDEEDEELQDSTVRSPSSTPLTKSTNPLPQFFDSKRDVILFCIDCSPSMQCSYPSPTYEDIETSHLYTALEAAMQIQKKKVVVGPQDAVGILFFNTVSPAISSA
jgi:ATP-dependent DNA helicase 2 subunit 1